MSLSRHLVRFAAVGACGTAIQYLMLWSGVNYLALPAAIASGIGFALGSVINYTLNYFFTFGSKKSHVEAAAKYYTIVGVGFCLNLALMTLFVHHWHWHYLLSQVLTTGLCFFWNFSGSRLWAFRHHEH